MPPIEAPTAPSSPPASSRPAAPASPPPSAPAPAAPAPAAAAPAPAASERTTLSPEAAQPTEPTGPVPNLGSAFGPPAPAAAAPAAPGTPAAAAPAAGAPATQPVGQRTEEALRNRDFRAQTQIAQDLLQRAGRGEAFSDEERRALRAIADGAQINATLQAAIYQKTSTPLGGGVTAFDKTQVGVVASNDPRVQSGGYVADTVGTERRIQLPNGTTITPYAQHTVRSDRADSGVEDTHGLQTGVRVEQRVGPARVGVDVNNTQSVGTAKLEGEFATPGARPGSTTRLGIDASVSARGNAFARETAQRALSLERRNQALRARSERYGIPFHPQAAN